jgi:lactoylglutathione lyase
MKIECRFDHIHVMAGDVATTAEWFRDFLGGQIVNKVESAERPRMDVDLGGIRLFVSPYAKAAPGAVDRRPGVDHLAFHVADVDGAVAELSGRGVVVLDPPFDSRPGVRAAFLQGPDGIRIELLNRG